MNAKKKKAYASEKVKRDWFKLASWAIVAFAIVGSVVAELLALEWTGLILAIIGWIILICFSGYFYYKGRHYSVEKDWVVIVLVVLLFVYYALVTNLLVAVLVGPLQFVIGYLRSIEKKKA